MACVLVEDLDTAGDIVAATLAAACQDHPLLPPAGSDTRVHLAGSVYHRCLGYLAAMERFPQLAGPHGRRPETNSPFDHLSVNQRALMALAVFGSHDVTQIGRILRMPMAAIVDQLPQVLPVIDIGAAGQSHLTAYAPVTTLTSR